MAFFEGSPWISSDPSTDLLMMTVVPVVTYTNADTMKESVIKENKGKSGIYIWVNNLTGKSYVGSSVNLGKRFSNYYNYNYLADPKRNMLIHRALIKYGYSQDQYPH